LPESTRSSTEGGPEDRVWVMILAGGIGSRFWPVSTPKRPKQLLPLAGERPMIVETVERASTLVPVERIRILAGRHLAQPFHSVLEDLPEESYWIEPQARGTAPVLAWAAWKLAHLDPDAVMVSLHADHRIRPLEAFRATVLTAVEVASRHDRLVCIGVTPDRIETAYGHIEPGAALSTTGSASAFEVAAFHEKPDSETARRYMEDGYLWNTGIFVWKASTLLEELAAHAPPIASNLHLIEDDDRAFFEAVPVEVIDRAVMERSDRVATVAATFAWDDVGSWEAVARTRPPDADGNVFVGPGTAVEAQRNIVFSEAGSVYVLGVDDLVVVRTEDKTVVLPRARAADLKAFLAKLEG
jgi:mannose-1-phosphate guanylyltransferase